MNLKEDLKTGVLYTSLAKFAGIFITLGVSAVLARLFTPEEFGIINIATVFIAFFSVFSDLGLGPAVIQKRDLTGDDLRGVFSLTIWTAVILALIFLAAAVPITNFYDGGPQLRNVLLILTANLFFNTLNMVPNALLLKEKRFKFAAVRQLAVQLVCGAAAIVAALLGMGIYALTINPVCSSIAIFVINYWQHPLKPRFNPGMDTVRKVFSFSAFQFGFQIVNYFSRNLDKLLMGRYISMADLGYYDKSYRLMMMPLQNISFVLTPVMHPVFAQIQDDRQHIASAYIRVIKLLAYIGFPLTAAMYFMSSDLILFFFGDQWGPSVPCFKILSLSVAFQIISSSSGAVFQASNDTKRLFGCGIFTAITMIGAICTGIFAFHDTRMVATCLCIAFAANFVQCYWSLFRGTLKCGWKEFWKTLVGPFVLAVILAAALWGLSFAIKGITNHFVALVIYTAVSVAISLAFVQLTGEYDILTKIKAKLCR